MSSNPVLDDDDILLIPAAGEAADTDTATSSSSISRGSVYPRWTENPNCLATFETPMPVQRQGPSGLTSTEQGPVRGAQRIEMGEARQSRQCFVVQMPQGPRVLTRVMPPVLPEPPVSFVGAYVVSCVVFWCFCLVVGGIAYIIATVGENHAYEGNIEKAKTFRRASFGVSGMGVLLGIVILIVVVTVIVPVYAYKGH